MPGGIRPPPEVMLAWPKPNMIDPESHGPSSIVLASVFGGIALVTVGVRLWARCVIQRRGGWDDLYAGLAVVPVLGLAVAFVLSSEVYGANLHTWDNTLPKLIAQRQVALAMETLYVVGSGLLRISVLLFYRRMGFRSVSQGFMLTTWVSIFSIIGYSIAFLAVIFGSCQPLHAFWDQIDPAWAASHTWKCYNEAVHILVATSVALIQDVVVTTLPAILCWNLRISFREKIALGSIFVVGYLTAVIAGIRFYFVVRLYYFSYDASWDSWYCWMLGMMELLIAITCSSLPAARVFFNQYKSYVDFVGTARGIKSVFSRSTSRKSISAERSRRASSSTVKLTEPVHSKNSTTFTDEGPEIELDRVQKVLV
ncbi:integral membrane protein [Aspergillus bombycis]|uniref:Integral membrane protein n=1 Tax=Aspergillus bombycis TaxID=109264 RepID=A0A1F8AGX0_9EURO|nr:integral membrane protein [Aspergillus bombycis]OGM50659.1 integral membrane protein [Aspergillus bombycis]